MTCVILQPSYIPWRGYFHQILSADVFVFYDDVQYDKHGWRNRNRIKTHQGPQWLTVPVHGRAAPVNRTPIHEVEIDWRNAWNRKHWMTLETSYRKAPHFADFAERLRPFYEARPKFLVELTIPLTIALTDMLGHSGTRFLRSSELGIEGSKTSRLINIIHAVGADRYLSGPSARDYLEEAEFAHAGIELRYMSYDYPEYPQLHPPYEPNVSILDLLFMAGPQAQSLIRSGTGSV